MANETKNAYRVKVEVALDSSYVQCSSWWACEISIWPGRPRLATRQTWAGEEPAWFGDSIGADRCPEVETLADRAKDALERYLSGKSAAWCRKIRSSVLSYPGLCACLPVRLPRRKGLYALATIELINPND